MNKGQNMYNYFKPIDFIPYTVAPDEVFVYITDKLVPGVKPYYMVSNYGRIYLRFNPTTPWMSLAMDSKGYWMVMLSTDTGSRPVRIHRLVKMAFDYFPGCEGLVVDHIDGNKRNPYLGNLAWVTESENKRLSVERSTEEFRIPPQITPQYIINDFDYIRKIKKENRERKELERLEKEKQKQALNDLKSDYNCQYTSTKFEPRMFHTDEEVHAICKMLQEGHTMSYVATKLHVKKSYVSSVYHGAARPDITNQYNFANYGTKPYHDKWIFTPEQVHAICDYMSKNSMSEAPNKKVFIKRMLSNLGIEYDDKKYTAILDIYRGRGYTVIAKKYNILK